jgi:radical S-adenosyl methionine domain-containing protein 2
MISYMTEMVVNLHVTERCNYSCSFCFGKWGLGASADELFADVPKARALIEAIFAAMTAADHAGTSVRFNFAGGEPGLLKPLPDLVDYCRQLGARVSFVTNGLVLKRFAVEWAAEKVDMVGISIDSASPATHARIGRVSHSGHAPDLDFLSSYVRRLRVQGSTEVKVNTVVCSENHREDLSSVIRALGPDKWKIFQVLPVYGDFGVITSDQFRAFLARHREFAGIIVSEDNDEMTGSYVMVDPLGRFFWRDEKCAAGYHYSDPILEAGAEVALRQGTVDWDKYRKRYARVG